MDYRRLLNTLVSDEDITLITIHLRGESSPTLYGNKVDSCVHKRDEEHMTNEMYVLYMDNGGTNPSTASYFKTSDVLSIVVEYKK